MKEYILDIQKKIGQLYDDKGDDTDEELLKLLELIKMEDNINFYSSFENQLSHLINPDENSILYFL